MIQVKTGRKNMNIKWKVIKARREGMETKQTNMEA